jgi:hypothetical protein
MAKKETPDQKSTREGGENELAGSRSASRAKEKMRQMDKRQQRKPQR